MPFKGLHMAWKTKNGLRGSPKHEIIKEDGIAREEMELKRVRILMVLVAILLLTVLLYAKNSWDEKIEQHAERALELKNESENENENENVSSEQDETAVAESPEEPEAQKETTSAFYEGLASREISTVKLIGDGLTAGYGHPGYTSPDGARIIFSGNGETYREAGPDFASWANKLREYTANPEFGEVDVFNAGIRDKTADWALRNIDRLLDPDEEAVIVMIGTDDRIFSTLEKYRAVMVELLAIADERSDILVVMSPPPSKEDIQPYNFTMEQADAVLKEISEERGYTFISQYDAIQQKLAEGVPYESLMQTEAANPVAGGYEVMWEEMRSGLGLE